MQEMLDNPLMDSLDVACLSDKNATEFFQDFAYNIMREPSILFDQDDFIPENSKKNATPILSTDDLGLELFELEISAPRGESGSDNYAEDDSDANVHDSEEDEDIFTTIDDELFEDPIKLLKWIEDSEGL
jgi:hypothetical protein